MALILETYVTENENCSSFFFHDSTPLYNSVENPGGYDPTGVNGFDPNSIDISNLILQITLPDNTIIEIVIPPNALNIDNIGGTGLITTEIVAEDLGYTDKITDGVYTFKYIIDDGNNKKYYNTCKILANCQVCQCLEKKLIDINLCTNCTESQRTRRINDLYHAWMLKDKAKHAVACNDVSSAVNIINYLLDYCNISRCDSCN